MRRKEGAVLVVAAPPIRSLVLCRIELWSCCFDASSMVPSLGASSSNLLFLPLLAAKTAQAAS